jgi:NDP-sugar pyrophosphorylase family protein
VNVERVTFPAMVADGSLYAFAGETYWIDAGTPATYLAANLDILSGQRGTPEEGVHPAATVAGTVERSVIGPGATVEEGASVIGSVVLPGAAIRRGAEVRDAIIGPRATIESDAIVEAGSVVGDGVVVTAGSRLSGKRVPEEAA